MKRLFARFNGQWVRGGYFVALALLLIGIILNAFRPVSHADEVILNEPWSGVCDVLENGVVYEQDFYVEAIDLFRVNVLAATYGRKLSSGSVHMQVLCGDKVLASTTLDAKGILDNRMIGCSINDGYLVDERKLLTLRIVPEGLSEEDALCFWFGNDMDGVSTLRKGTNALERTLIIEALYRETVWHWQKIYAYILALLALVTLYPFLPNTQKVAA